METPGNTHCGNKKYLRRKELTDGTIRNVEEFDRCTEVREDEGDAAYYAS